MSKLFLYSTAIALTLLQAATAPRQVLDPKTDRDAYAIYATLLRPDPDGEGNMRPPILLQAETEGPPRCAEFLAGMSGEWAEVANNFQRENSRARLLQAGVPMGIEYRLVPREEILADDARLAAKDPRRLNAPRPGSIKYLALSAVGFNAARTKALVYVRFRTAHFSDAVLMKQLKEGKWVTGPASCGGVA